MDQDLIGQKIVVNGIELLVNSFWDGQYVLHSVKSFGVWFATPEQLATATA